MARDARRDVRRRVVSRREERQVARRERKPLIAMSSRRIGATVLIERSNSIGGGMEVRGRREKLKRAWGVLGRRSAWTAVRWRDVIERYVRRLGI